MSQKDRDTLFRFYIYTDRFFRTIFCVYTEDR